MNERIIYEMPPRLDAVSSPSADRDIKELLEQGVMDLELNMEKTGYISSAGLRVLLTAKKRLDSKKGKLVLTHVCSQIREIFDVTGFSGFLTVEDE